MLIGRNYIKLYSKGLILDCSIRDFNPPLAKRRGGEHAFEISIIDKMLYFKLIKENFSKIFSKHVLFFK